MFIYIYIPMDMDTYLHLYIYIHIEDFLVHFEYFCDFDISHRRPSRPFVVPTALSSSCFSRSLVVTSSCFRRHLVVHVLLVFPFVIPFVIPLMCHVVFLSPHRGSFVVSWSFPFAAHSFVRVVHVPPPSLCPRRLFVCSSSSPCRSLVVTLSLCRSFPVSWSAPRRPPRRFLGLASSFPCLTVAP